MTPLTVERFVGGRVAEAKDVLALAQEHGVRMVDFKFTDLPGTWQHLGLSIHALDEEAFAEGLGFDGSSIRGFQEIAESDMVLLPDPASALIDPFHEQKTMSVLCDVIDPITREPYSRDPRYVALKAERYLAGTGIADTCFMGPEAEFYVFEHVAFDQTANRAFYEVDSEEGYWNRGRGFGAERNGTPNLGYKIRSQQGYFPTVPGRHSRRPARADGGGARVDGAALRVPAPRGGLGGPGGDQRPLQHAAQDGRPDPAAEVRDQERGEPGGKTATFMPKPLFEENGSGMHVHMSLGRGGENLMFDFDGYAQLSREALNFIGGILAHGRALMAFCAPTTNRYKRLVPGYEAPVNLAYSRRNRSAACRIPMYSASPKAKRVEFRPPDPSCNPYLAFAALLMAGLDGVANKIDPGEPLDKDFYDLSPEELKRVPSMPSSLEEALFCLEEDHHFLLKGDVFTEELIETYIAYKSKHEAEAVRLRPHPYEFSLYYDS